MPYKWVNHGEAMGMRRWVKTPAIFCRPRAKPKHFIVPGGWKTYKYIAVRMGAVKCRMTYENQASRSLVLVKFASDWKAKKWSRLSTMNVNTGRANGMKMVLRLLWIGWRCL